MRTFVPRILYHVSAYFEEQKLFEMISNIPGNIRSVGGQRERGTYDIWSLFAKSYSTSEIFLNNRGLQYKNDSESLFVWRAMWKAGKVCYYYSSHVYSALRRSKRLEKFM